jgi:hypothetical protein
LSTAKHGTGLDTNAHDAAISASLLLQYGCPSETLRRALTAGIFVALLNLNQGNSGWPAPRVKAAAT